MDNDSRISTLEQDMSSVKADVAVIRSNYVTKVDLQAARTELKSDIQDLRIGLKAEIQAVRMELKAEIQESRLELKGDILGLRAELHKELHAQTWRVYGFGVFLLAGFHLLNRYGY